MNRLHDGSFNLEDYLILPEATENTSPSWFGFLITVQDGINREDLVRYLESQGIQTRMLFAGNLLKHPCFIDSKVKNSYRIIGSLENTEIILNRTFWSGVYPGMTDDMLNYMINVLILYFR